jgi:hypothetical protein
LVKGIANTPERRQNYRRTMTSPADVIQLSGCKDYQTSADAIEGVNQNLMLEIDDRDNPRGR